MTINRARLEQERIPQVYGRIASVYDIWARLTESRARARCLELAAIKDGEAVLEVAVGTGLAFAKVLEANPSGRNVGIDLTDAMLRRAVRRAAMSGQTNFELRKGDAYSLDFADGTFDVVLCNYLFDLLPARDFQRVLGEFRRVLRPPGRLVLVNMTDGERWYNGLWKWIYRINPAWLGGCRSVALIPYLEGLGFRNSSREYMSQMTFPSEIIYAEAS